MFRKALSILLAVLMVMCSFTLSFFTAYAQQVSHDEKVSKDLVKLGTVIYGDYEYRKNDDGTVEIVNYMGTINNLTIPTNLDGYTVTRIGSRSFANCAALTDITIPDTIYRIGESAFQNCTNLTDVKIPQSVTDIGGSAFSNCIKLNHVSLPDGITYILWGTFKGCSSLTDVTVSNNVICIGVDAFKDTPLYDQQADGLIYIGKVMYRYKGKCTESITIKEGTLGISESAFLDCIDIKSVSIPNSVTMIGANAFKGCVNLITVDIPDSVIRIDNNAFANTDWYNNQSDGLIYAGKVAYKLKGECPKSVIIEDGTLGISASAFSNCENLSDIIIPNSVTNIGSASFYNCKSLTSITIPSSVTYFGKGAFSGSSVNIIYGYVQTEAEKYANENGFLFVPIDTNSYEYTVLSDGTAMITKYTGNDAKLTIPNEIDGIRVTEIGNSAFWDCHTLTSVTVPEGVTSIGNQAFMWCENLSEINLPSTVTHVGFSAFSQTAFMNNHSEDNVKYCGNVLCEITDFDDDTKLAVKDGTTVIADSAAGAANITEISFPNSLKTIGKRAFKGCRELTNISWSDSITTIGDGAFEECTNLKIKSLPSELEYLGNSAFCYCSALESMTIPDSMTVIQEGTFFDCKNLKCIYLPKTLTEIGSESIGYNLSNKYTIEKATDFTIYGYCGTRAERYAEDNAFVFISLDGEENTILGDVDGDEGITVVDATFIQRHLASIPIPFVLNKTIA